LDSSNGNQFSGEGTVRYSRTAES